MRILRSQYFLFIYRIDRAVYNNELSNFPKGKLKANAMLKKKFLLIFTCLILMSSTALAEFGGEPFGGGRLPMKASPFSSGNFSDDEWAPFAQSLTYLKQFNSNQGTLDADRSIGSPTATFTATRSASTPATYIDFDGVIQLVTTSNVARWTQGYYDSSGFTAGQGLLLEGARTNLLIRTDGTAHSSGFWTGWTNTTTITGTEVVTNVEPDISGISGGTAQRQQYTGVAGDAPSKIINIKSPTTADGSIAQNDIIAVSFWMRAQTTNSGVTLRCLIRERDSGASSLASSNATITPTTSWTRYERIYTVTQATAARMNLEIGITSTSGGVDDEDTYDLEIWGVQVEVSAYPSSFIPTTTAALTRNEEINEGVIVSNRIAATESCVIKFRPDFANGVAGDDQYLIDTDTKSRNIRYTSGSNDFEIFSNESDSSGSTVSDLVNTSWSANESITLGYSMQSTGNPNISAYFNGVADGTDSNTDFTAPAWGANFQIGADNSTGNNFFGMIEAVACFDRFLSASEHKQVYDIFN